MPDDLHWYRQRGHAVVETDGTDVTAIRYWVGNVWIHGETEDAREREDARADLGAPEEVTVGDGRITVPAVDLAFGSPPDDPIPAGRYEIVLENHGGIAHTLVNDELGVALEPDHDAGEVTAATHVELEPGTYTFYCQVPGHREVMEFGLKVAEPSDSS